MKKIVIFGNRGHSKVVEQEVKKDSELSILKIVGFKINSKNKITLSNKNFLEKFKKKKNKLFAITAVGDNKVRKILVTHIQKKFKKVQWIKIISKNSVVEKNVKIKPGTIVISGAVINTNVSIGKHSIVNTRSSIDHETNLGNYVNIAPGAIIAGQCKIKDNVFVGIGSLLKENITVERNTIIGGGSFVNKNCASNSKYFGNPVRLIKKL